MAAHYWPVIDLPKVYIHRDCLLCDGVGNIVYVYGNHPDSPDGGDDKNVALCDVCYTIFRQWQRIGAV